jgi:hypothetical protein
VIFEAAVSRVFPFCEVVCEFSYTKSAIWLLEKENCLELKQNSGFY